MSEPKKFLDEEGVTYLWSKISMEDYPNNDILVAVLNAIDETKADKSTTLAGYGIIDTYTKSEIDAAINEAFANIARAEEASF